MPYDYVLINTAPSREKEVLSELEKRGDITDLCSLFGEYDIIVKIENEDFDVLQKIIAKDIRALPGIVNTKTLLGASVD